MMKHAINISAILIALTAFGLSSPTKINFSTYVWYAIKPSIHRPCNTELTSVNINDLLIDFNYVSTTAGFQNDTQGVTFGSGEASNLFLCDLINEELCAVGYAKPAFGSSGFTIWNGKWIPTGYPVVRTCMTALD